jgi:hypothetical protein
VALLAVGIPSFVLTAWARPGKPSRDSIVVNLARFVVPTALTLTAFGVAVYLLFLLTDGLSGQAGLASPAVYAMTQTAVTLFSTLASIIAIALADLFFVRPGTSRPWARPSVRLVAAMLAVAVIVTAIPWGRDFFTLAPLSAAGYLAVAAATLLWLGVTTLVLRLRLFERTFLFS